MKPLIRKPCIKRFLNKLRVRNVFRNATKLSNFIKLGKDPLDRLDK